MNQVLKKCGFEQKNIFFVPINAWENKNISKRITETPWKEFPSLLETVQILTNEKKKENNNKESRINLFIKKKILRAAILKERIQKDELVVRVFSGSIKTGEKLMFANRNTCVCKSITDYTSREKLVVAKNGDVVIIKMEKPLDFQKFVEVSWNTKSRNKGTLLKSLKRMIIGNSINPPKFVRVIYGIIVNLSGHLTIKEGNSPVCVFAGAQVRIRILKISNVGKILPKGLNWDDVEEKEVEEMLKKNYKKIESKEKKSLRSSYVGRAVIELTQPTTLETCNNLQNLGRFFLFGRELIGAFKVMKILK